jgi:hypothetical protein
MNTGIVSRTAGLLLEVERGGHVPRAGHAEGGEVGLRVDRHHLGRVLLLGRGCRCAGRPTPSARRAPWRPAAGGRTPAGRTRPAGGTSAGGPGTRAGGREPGALLRRLRLVVDGDDVEVGHDVGRVGVGAHQEPGPGGRLGAGAHADPDGGPLRLLAQVLVGMAARHAGHAARAGVVRPRPWQEVARPERRGPRRLPRGPPRPAPRCASACWFRTNHTAPPAPTRAKSPAPPSSPSSSPTPTDDAFLLFRRGRSSSSSSRRPAGGRARAVVGAAGGRLPGWRGLGLQFPDHLGYERRPAPGALDLFGLGRAGAAMRGVTLGTSDDDRHGLPSVSEGRGGGCRPNSIRRHGGCEPRGRPHSRPARYNTAAGRSGPPDRTA